MVLSLIESVSALEELRSQAHSKSVLYFWADWHEQSKKGGQMYGIFSALSEKYPDINFYAVEAESVPDVSELMGVSVVPTFFTLVGRKVIGKVEGATPAEVSKLIKQLKELDAASVVEVDPKEAEEKALKIKLEKLTKLAPVMLFMKGSPEQPKCGFSRQIVDILNENQIPFASFDILTDPVVRAGLKEFSDWPTYPQLYVKGEFMGGLDIIKEMNTSDEGLKTQLGVTDLKVPPPPPPLEERLKALIEQAPVMAFIKGSPSVPKCGFSRSLVELLQKEGIEFSHFDILTDDEVRQGLKTYSDWPTYPQLYVKGTLVGGLDIVQEMQQGGDLKSQLLDM